MIMTQFENFQERFKLLAGKNKDIIVNTLSNIFTMRLIGNKTHGDLAEIGMVEFINQFMYDFKSIHVGKDLFRAKEHEEDIMIINEITKEKFPVSLKAYGDGPLQLSTDSDQRMFPFLEKQGKDVSDFKIIKSIFSAIEFANFDAIHILPLIYDEKNQRCNIMIFSHKKAIDDTNGRYICEVRYGGASANALQRGLWTHTKNALPYFKSLTSGWIDYSHNRTLVKLFGLALNSTEVGHRLANEILQKDIDKLKKM